MQPRPSAPSRTRRSRCCGGSRRWSASADVVTLLWNNADRLALARPAGPFRTDDRGIYVPPRDARGERRCQPSPMPPVSWPRRTIGSAATCRVRAGRATVPISSIARSRSRTADDTRSRARRAASRPTVNYSLMDDNSAAPVTAGDPRQPRHGHRQPTAASPSPSTTPPPMAARTISRPGPAPIHHDPRRVRRLAEPVGQCARGRPGSIPMPSP